MIIGLHGRIGSGKDTVYERMVNLHPDLKINRVGFADKLKESACALLGISRDEIERLKRDDNGHCIEVVEMHSGSMALIKSKMTVRKFLQRYGTEAHRNIFGEQFWINAAMNHVDDLRARDEWVVMTDVRFDNEAEAIRERGGCIWQIVGPSIADDDHASEKPIDASLVDYTIDNSLRNSSLRFEDYKYLDAQIASAVKELQVV